MQALTGAIATRVCYAYGFDAADPNMRHMIDRMVVRAYRNQTVKAGSVKKAGAAFKRQRVESIGARSSARIIASWRLWRTC